MGDAALSPGAVQVGRSGRRRRARGEASVNELAAPFDISLSAISRHLKVLEKAELVERHKQAQFRRCRRPERLKQAVEWIEEHHRFRERQFDALALFLEQTQEEKEDDEHQHGEG